MLRYKTQTRPGLVALYDIRPGNRAGPFLQPHSPQGAHTHTHTLTCPVNMEQEVHSLQTPVTVCSSTLGQAVGIGTGLSVISPLRHP